jgi:WXG100 family type VII secretion target
MLQVNEESLKKAKTSYNEQAQRMRELKVKLCTAVDGIKEGWDSKAGDEFFKKYDNEWVKNITDYIDVIQHMSDNMQIADNKYQTVFDTADNIKLH